MPQAQVTALQEEAKGLETGKEVGSLSLTLAALAVATEEWQLGSQDGWYCHKHKRAQALVKLSNRWWMDISEAQAVAATDSGAAATAGL